jgi:hypothetical protein
MSNEVAVQDQPSEEKNVINYNPIFPTLTAVVNIDLPIEDMARDLWTLAGETENCDGGYTTFMTRQTIDHIKGIDEAKQAIYGIACAFGREQKFEVNYDKAAVNIWANVMRRGGIQSPMSHTNSYFAGVINISVAEDDSPLLLSNPTYLYRGHEGFIRPDDYGPFTAPSMSMKTKNNQLLIWPSWLQYAVPKMKTSGPRVTLGFTVDFLPPGV